MLKTKLWVPLISSMNSPVLKGGINGSNGISVLLSKVDLLAFGLSFKSYKILILKYPEKSSFFADQIRELKRLLNA